MNELRTNATPEETAFPPVPEASKEKGPVFEGPVHPSGGLKRIIMSRDGPPTKFEFPKEDGGTETASVISCIILHYRPSNTRYATRYGGGPSRPECRSNDGIRGTGDPGGLCSECAFNRFGSGGGNRKACKNHQLLYLLLSEKELPMTLLVPANSLNSFHDYCAQQLRDGFFPGRIITKLQLKEAVNASGFVFSQIVFERERVLTAEESAVASQMTALVRKYDTFHK